MLCFSHVEDFGVVLGLGKKEHRGTRTCASSPHVCCIFSYTHTRDFGLKSIHVCRKPAPFKIFCCVHLAHPLQLVSGPAFPATAHSLSQYYQNPVFDSMAGVSIAGLLGVMGLVLTEVSEERYRCFFFFVHLLYTGKLRRHVFPVRRENC